MLFKKEQKTERPRPSRITSMSDSELKSWLNTCLMELGATYDQWSYHRGSPDEFDKVLTLINDLWEELKGRAN